MELNVKEQTILTSQHFCNTIKLRRSYHESI